MLHVFPLCSARDAPRPPKLLDGDTVRYDNGVKSQFAAYIDESSAPRGFSHQVYMVCAAIIDVDEAEMVREALYPLLLPGQIKLHWTDESASRRRSIIKTIASIDSMQAIVTHRSAPSRKTERFRRKCLEQMYYELTDMRIHDVTLESRQDAQNRRDVEHIVALQGQGQCVGLRIQHVRGGDDPLLWIPDAVLGALNSSHSGNDQFWEPLQDKLLLNRETPDSLSKPTGR